MILVTGASGFVGAHLARALIERGEKTILLSKSGKFDPFLEKKAHACFKLDIARKAGLAGRFPGGIRAVFHTAIHNPAKPERKEDFSRCIETNAIGTFNLLEFCRERGICRFIYSTSIGVYGGKITPPVGENHPIQPASAYGIGKRAGEMFCLHYQRHHGIEPFILRYSSVYGLHQRPDSVLPIFIRRAREGKEIVIHGAGKKRQDFVYIKDVVRANLLALDSRKPGFYQIGSGAGTSMPRLARTVCKVFGGGRKISIRRDASIGEDGGRIWLDVSKAARGLRYKPQFDLEKGLRDYKREMEKAGE